MIVTDGVIETFRARSLVNSTIRRFLEAQDFIEVCIACSGLRALSGCRMPAQCLGLHRGASLPVQGLGLHRGACVTNMRVDRLIIRTLNSEPCLQVETPVLERSAGGAEARPFLTYHNALGRSFTLRIATGGIPGFLCNVPWVALGPWSDE